MEKTLKAIENDVKTHAVLLYMKGSPDFPQCGFSSFVCAVLQKLGVSFEARNVLEDNTLRQAIKTFSNWPTIPQLYVNGQFIGGCDIVKNMYESGELSALFKKAAPESQK